MHNSMNQWGEGINMDSTARNIIVHITLYHTPLCVRTQFQTLRSCTVSPTKKWRLRTSPVLLFSVAFLAFLAQNVDIGCCIGCYFLERLWGVRGPALDSSQACAAEEDENGKRTLVFYLLALL